MVDYNASKGNPAHYFNQKLLNFNQHFAPDADFFLRSLYDQHTWVQQYTLLSTKLNQVHSQQKH